MKRNKKTSGFTLIELLMVIAIIGLLAGILIPTVSVVRKQANIAASKSQLSSYVNAIQLFKGEYGYLPFVTGAEDEEDEEVILSEDDTSINFIETLSGRDATDPSATVVAGGNRRLIPFHSFSESEFYIDPGSGDVDRTQIADRFNNRNIVVVLDSNGDNEITVEDENGEDKIIRATVSIYVEEDDEIDAPNYTLSN